MKTHNLILLGIIIEMFLISVNAVFSQNFTNEETNKIITMDLRYKNGTLFDPNDNGVENIDGVIDFTLENSIFSWQVNESNLCTQWDVYSIDNQTSTSLCYGNQKCCNFINLQPSRTNWSDIFYLYYVIHN